MQEIVLVRLLRAGAGYLGQGLEQERHDHATQCRRIGRLRAVNGGKGVAPLACAR